MFLISTYWHILQYLQTKQLRYLNILANNNNLEEEKDKSSSLSVLTLQLYNRTDIMSNYFGLSMTHNQVHKQGISRMLSYSIH